MFQIVEPGTPLLTKVIRLWMAGGFLLFLFSFFICPDQGTQKKVFYVAVVAPVFFSLFRREFRLIFADPVFRWLAVTLLYLALPVFWSPDYSPEFIKRVAKDSFYILCLFLAAWYVIAYMKVPLDYLLIAMLVVATVVGVILAFEFYRARNWDFSQWFWPDWKFFNKNRTAKTYGMISVIGVGLFWLSQNQKIRWFALGCAGIAIVLVALSRSFGGGFAVLFVLPLLFFRGGSERFSGKAKIIAIGVFCILLITPMYVLDTTSLWAERGWSKRDQIWPVVLDMWWQSPLFGEGVLKRPIVIGIDGGRYHHEHNLVLALLRQSGVIGAGLMIWFFGALLYRSIPKQGTHHRLAEGMIVYSFVASMSGGIYPIEKPDDSWFWVWVPLALAFAIQMMDRDHGKSSEAKA
ncbi:MAG: hypothetical protein MI867_22665 [Pseudomonadales bacterium]|nr:hypothetical protein [Pseudomonadales bacterium]